jgi:hypothetical protein
MKTVADEVAVGRGLVKIFAHVLFQSTKGSSHAQIVHAKTIHTTCANISTQVAHKYQVPML